jgi:hypothetical protein
MDVMRQLFALLVLRANPQDLPSSPVLLGVALAAHTLAGVLTLAASFDLAPAVQAAFIDTALSAALAWLLLKIWNRLARFTQTVTALAASNALLSLAAAWLPLAALGDTVSALLWGGFFLWYLVVSGHILRHALDVPLMTGMALSFLCFLTAASVVGVVLGPVTAIEE